MSRRRPTSSVDYAAPDKVARVGQLIDDHNIEGICRKLLDKYHPITRELSNPWNRPMTRSKASALASALWQLHEERDRTLQFPKFWKALFREVLAKADAAKEMTEEQFKIGFLAWLFARLSSTPPQSAPMPAAKVNSKEYGITNNPNSKLPHFRLFDISRDG